MTWSGGNDGTLTMLQATLLEPQPFQVLGGSCQDGTIYYAMQSVKAIIVIVTRVVLIRLLRTTGQAGKLTFLTTCELLLPVHPLAPA